MYLPTFWKLTMEAYRYKMYHMAGWGVPFFIVGKLFIRKNLFKIITLNFYLHLKEINFI